MLLNSQTARDAFIEFNGHFKKGLSATEEEQIWRELAEETNSKTQSENYTWLRDIPGMREWVGQRQVQSLAQSDYVLKNVPFEATVSVPKDAFEDNLTSSYDKPMEMLGRAVGKHPDDKIIDLIINGTTNLCHDGLSFFNASHPANDDGDTYSNYDSGGGGDLWYVLALDEIVKPFIYQKRKAPNFVAKTKEDDDGVFYNKELVFGVDYRGAFGYTFPQLAFASTQTLNSTNLNTVLQTMAEYESYDSGRKLGIKPTHLICGYGNRAAALALLEAERNANGSTNIDYKALKLMLHAKL